MPRNHRRRRRLVALLAVSALLLLALPLALGAAQSNPGQRIDLKVLVIEPAPGDPVAAAWRSALDGEGVPNETRVISPTAPDLGDGDLADYGANRAYYQAVIVAHGSMDMAAGETAALDRFQSTFGLRMLRDNTEPKPQFGLNPAPPPGDQGGPGKTAALTDAGKQLFSYLHGTVPIDSPAFGWQAQPMPGFTTLLSGPNGAAYLGINRRAGGQEEMISTLTGGRFQTHHQLLRHGIITWVTGGVFLGNQRNYYEMQVDDIFLPNDRWDMNENKTGVDEPTTSPDEYQCDRDPETPIRDCLPAIRMQPADVARTIQWQKDNGLKLDMVFNGYGSDEAIQETGSDALANAFLASKSEFPWINHTYSHPKLFTASRSTIVDEVAANVRWAAEHGISIDPAELVTGEHSGLDNPEMPGALQELGIRWIASDNSRESSQRAIGPAITIPRYPSNVYYNVGTEQEQLDEYNWIYRRPPQGKCIDTPANTCRTTDASWDEYVNSEANIMFDHMLDNDPRPHYAHQSNLTLENAADGKPVFLEVMDAVLARYRPYVKVPIVQLSHTAIGEELQRRARWNADRSGVSAYLKDGFVHFTNTTPRAVPVPVTGTEIGTVYGDQRSGWITLEPQQTTSAPAPAAAGKPRQTARIALRGVKIKPKRFPVTGKRKRRGTRISWRVSQAATLRMTFQRRVRGRKVGRTCRKTTRRNRGRKRCWRYVSVGTLKRSVRAGNGRYKFKGKVSRRGKGKVRSRRLKRGTHRLVVTAQARNRAAGTSAARRVKFTVVKARSRRR